MIVDSLFPDLEPVPLEQAAPVENLSAGRRLTLRQKALADKGLNPMMGTHPPVDGATCGGCRYRVVGQFPKCHWRPGGGIGALTRISHGSATDVRAWWPGCREWEAP